jgi:ferredoxin
MAYKISIDAEECIGCGACTAISDNFEMDGDKAVVKSATVKELGTNQEAADGCPKGCIKIEKTK